MPTPARSHGRLSSLAAILFGVVLFGAAGALLWSARSTDASPPAIALQSLKGSSNGPSSTAVQPAAVQPAAVQPAAVQPAAAQPAAVQPKGGQTSPTAPGEATPAAPAAKEAAKPAPTEPSSLPPGVTAKHPPTVAPVPPVPAKEPAQPVAGTPRTNAEKMRQALTTDEDAKRRAKPATGRRRPAPAPVAAAKPPEAPRAAEEAKKPPEWAEGKDVPVPAKQSKRNTTLGTNNAPIFE